MIIRVFALTALLVAVSCDTDAPNNRQQKILQRRPTADSVRAGPPTPAGGPNFRPPSAGPTAPSKPAFSPPPRPKNPAFKPHQPQVEYGFTPINVAANGHVIGGSDNPHQQQTQEAHHSAPVEVKKPLLINVAPPPKRQQAEASVPVSFSYQNSNHGVVEGNFKEKPSFVIQHQQQHHQQQQQQRPEKPSFSVQNKPQKTSETQLTFGPSTFSFNQPVGAKINFESEQSKFENSAFPSIESSFISAGPPKVEKFPPKPPSGPSFPPKEQHQNVHKFPKQPPPPPPSFSKNPPQPNFSQKPVKEQQQFSNFPPPQQPNYSQKPIKEQQQFSNFPPPQFYHPGKKIVGDSSRIPFDTKKVAPPPPPPQYQPVYRGPPKKNVQQKPSSSFEIQKASVIGPFSGPPIRPQRLNRPQPPPPPPPRPVSQPPQETKVHQVEEPLGLRNPEFANFPPADFGNGRPTQEEVTKSEASQLEAHLPPPSPQFVQETNPQLFTQSFSSIQHAAQQPQLQQHAQPQLQQHTQPQPQLQLHQQQHQVIRHPQPQFQQQHHQIHQHPQLKQHQQPQIQQHPQFQLQHQQQVHQPLPQHQPQQPQFGFASQLPPQFTTQPQFQLQGAQPQFQLPSTFPSHDASKLSTLNPFLSTLASGPSGLSGAGLSQFGALSQLQSQRINPGFGGLSTSGLGSQLGLSSAYPQFNPNLAAAANLYKGILPAQQYPSGAGASSFPFSSPGLNPYFQSALQSSYPLRSSVPSAVATHSVPGSEGIPQFQPLPNSLNFPDSSSDDDEQDLAASQTLKKFAAPPKNNGTKAKKTTLKDILLEDCSGAEDFGYCASPPRYPTQQIKTVLKQCKDELEGLFEVEEEEVADEHHVAKRDAKPAEQFTWTSESCTSTAATVEPGYARDFKGHWMVVVQQAASKVHQRVDVDVCASEGGDCGCKQYYETKNLVAWDPDHPNDCPVMRAFKFPSKCDCPTQ